MIIDLNRIPVLSSYLKYLRFFRYYTGNHIILYSLVCIIASVVEGFGITLFFPLLLEFITDSTGQKPQSQFFNKIFITLGLSSSIQSILLCLIVVFVMKGFILLGAGIYQSFLASTSVRKIRVNLLEGISELDYEYFMLQNTGNLTNLVNNEVGRILGFFIAYTRTFPFIASIGIFTLGLVWIDWMLAMFVVIISIFVFGIFRFVTVRIERFSHSTTEQNSNLSNKYVQFVQAFKYFISTNGFRRLKPQIHKIIKELSNLEYKVFNAFFITGAFSDPISLISLVFIMLFQLYILQHPAAVVMVTILFLQRIVASVLTLQAQWQNCQSYSGSYEIVARFISDLEHNKETFGEKSYSEFTDSIRLEKVTFAFGDQTIVDSIDIEIKKNSMVAIVGESGGGKSTIANLVTGILKPTSGRVMIDNNDLTSINLLEYRASIGFVLQEGMMFDDTMSNNISLWQDVGREEVEYASSQALCREFIEKLPKNFDTIAGDRGIKLSGGERQRIAIARELLKKPDIMIMDEATSSLDSSSEYSIRESIENLKGSVTLLIIAHRLSTIKNCNYLYVLDKGKIVEEGTYSGLRDNMDSIFNKMCEMQNL